MKCINWQKNVVEPVSQIAIPKNTEASSFGNVTTATNGKQHRTQSKITNSGVQFVHPTIASVYAMPCLKPSLTRNFLNIDHCGLKIPAIKAWSLTGTVKNLIWPLSIKAFSITKKSTFSIVKHLLLHVAKTTKQSVYYVYKITSL